MKKEVPEMGYILSQRQENVIQAFRDHLGTFSHLPYSDRFLPTGYDRFS